MGENETEIDFVLIKNVHRWFMEDVKATAEEFQHALVIAGIDTKIRDVVKKACAVRVITLLKDVKII